MNKFMSKEEYIKYFTHMQEEDKKCMLGCMAWDDIGFAIHNAIENDKLFTKEELIEKFPSLLGFLKEK